MPTLVAPTLSLLLAFQTLTLCQLQPQEAVSVYLINCFLLLSTLFSPNIHIELYWKQEHMKFQSKS